ncbi:hypothetical protein BURPS668_A1138 [Burkholderia pseudomallei 668]|nr:hypothetical protein BURPS668_A1138 [Burkholderia pseudomallei 668]
MREGGRGAANLSVAAPGASRPGVAAWRAWRLPLRTTSAACAGGGARAVRMVAPRRCVVLRCVAGRSRTWYAAHACAGIADATRAASRQAGTTAHASAHPRFACATAAGNGGDAAQTPFLAAPPRRAGGIATASFV